MALTQTRDTLVDTFHNSLWLLRLLLLLHSRFDCLDPFLLVAVDISKWFFVAHFNQFNSVASEEKTIQQYFFFPFQWNDAISIWCIKTLTNSHVNNIYPRRKLNIEKNQNQIIHNMNLFSFFPFDIFDFVLILYLFGVFRSTNNKNIRLNASLNQTGLNLHRCVDIQHKKI